MCRTIMNILYILQLVRKSFRFISVYSNTLVLVIMWGNMGQHKTELTLGISAYKNNELVIISHP